jgi:hypothetical protein
MRRTILFPRPLGGSNERSECRFVCCSGVGVRVRGKMNFAQWVPRQLRFTGKVN